MLWMGTEFLYMTPWILTHMLIKQWVFFSLECLYLFVCLFVVSKFLSIVLYHILTLVRRFNITRVWFTAVFFREPSSLSTWELRKKLRLLEMYRSYSPQCHHRPGMMVHACVPSVLEIEARRGKVQSQPGLHSKKSVWRNNSQIILSKKFSSSKTKFWSEALHSMSIVPVIISVSSSWEYQYACKPVSSGW